MKKLTLILAILLVVKATISMAQTECNNRWVGKTAPNDEVRVSFLYKNDTINNFYFPCCGYHELSAAQIVLNKGSFTIGDGSNNWGVSITGGLSTDGKHFGGTYSTHYYDREVTYSSGNWIAVPDTTILPQPLGIIGDTVVCSGTAHTYSYNSPNIGYSWSATGGTNVGACVSWDSAGVQTLTAKPIGCPTAAIKTLKVRVKPTPTIHTVNDTICGAGSLTLRADASAGIPNWYPEYGYVTPIYTGTSFTTPRLVESKYYFTDVTNNGCTSPKVQVWAIVNANIIRVSGDGRCGPGTLNLYAYPSSGTVSWYADSIGGVVLGTGRGFGPNLLATKVYYVDATYNSCTPGPRTPVTATIAKKPNLEITSTKDGWSCGPGKVTLGATRNRGEVYWYADSIGGAPIAYGGNTFTTPSLTTTKVYYVEARISYPPCDTFSAPRKPVTARINTVVPTITCATNVSRCGVGSVTLEAIASDGTVSWYAASTSGSPLATGTSFTTNSLTSPTTCYVAATYRGCTTPTRTKIEVAVNGVITTKSDNARCGQGSLTLSAAATNGVISWYTNSTGGTQLGTGNEFITPVLSTTTVYYIDATYNDCTPGPRAAVTATIKSKPLVAITSTQDRSLCGPGKVPLIATASLADVYWYADSTGGTSLTVGKNFLTPSLTSTKVYYVEARTMGSGCDTFSTPRKAVTATIKPVPTITSIHGASHCGSGELTLSASASAGTISWYNTDGFFLGSGNSYTTWRLYTTADYWVSSSYNGCTSVLNPYNSKATAQITSAITRVEGAERCGPGTFTLKAWVSGIETINWYADSVEGTSLGTGWSFTTPVLNATSYFYVDATYNGCTTEKRTAVLARINLIPPPLAIDGSRCGSGIVTLGATTILGIQNLWYSDSTGGLSIGSGNKFTTPVLNSTTTYYAGFANGSCVSRRTAVTATINPIPTILSKVDSARCGAGTVTLRATASAGAISWYADSIGGTTLGTGTSFTTPVLTSSTDYYVNAMDKECTTASRSTVKATINSIPTITGTTDSSRCGAGTVTLRATSSAGTISWYADSIGGSTLGTGTSFITPVLTSSTDYYVDASDKECTTASRSIVKAIINSIPTITGTTDSSRCGVGTVMLKATASAGAISWYAESIGGSTLGTGNSFITPVLTSSTDYYVDASDKECTTASRTAVKAIILNDIGCSTNTYTILYFDKIRIYPNPTVGVANVSVSKLFDKSYSIELYNCIGNQIYTAKIQDSEKSVQVDLSGYPPGMYFIRIRTKNEIYQSPIIKN